MRLASPHRSEFSENRQRAPPETATLPHGTTIPEMVRFSSFTRNVAYASGSSKLRVVFWSALNDAVDTSASISGAACGCWAGCGAGFRAAFCACVNGGRSSRSRISSSAYAPTSSAALYVAIRVGVSARMKSSKRTFAL